MRKTQNIAARNVTEGHVLVLLAGQFAVTGEPTLTEDFHLVFPLVDGMSYTAPHGEFILTVLVPQASKNEAVEAATERVRRYIETYRSRSEGANYSEHISTISSWRTRWEDVSLSVEDLALILGVEG